MGPLSLRWEALALAVIILAALLVWAANLRGLAGTFRADDVLYVILGVVPGAVVGGRVMHGLAFVEAYVADPAGLLDLGQGSLSLLGAVVGGTLSGAYVSRLLGHRTGAWADAATVPLLMAIGLGKLALVLAGGGQGAPLDAPWALAFDGAGPWLSADPGTAALPSQVYEGLFALAGIALAPMLLRRRSKGGRGHLFLAGVAWWLAGRCLAAVTWRDEALLAGLGVEGLAALICLVMVLAILAWRRVRSGGVRVSTS